MVEKEEKTAAGAPQRAQPPFARWLTPIDDLDRLFEDVLGFRSLARSGLLGRGLERTGEVRVPRVDVIDRENEIVVKAELPGVDKKDLDVCLSENLLTIKGQSCHQHEEEQGDYYRSEISKASFSRSVPLPCYVDSDKAKASFQDGILELTLPKAEQSRRRRIDVS